MSRARAVELGRRLRDAAGLGRVDPGRRRPVVRCPHPAAATTRPAPSTSRPGTARAASTTLPASSTAYSRNPMCRKRTRSRTGSRRFATMSSVRETLEVFRPEVFDIPLKEHIAATATRDWRDARDVEHGLARPLEDPPADQAAAPAGSTAGQPPRGARRRRASSASTGSSSSAAAAAPRSHRASTRGWRCSRGLTADLEWLDDATAGRAATGRR